MRSSKIILGGYFTSILLASGLTYADGTLFHEFTLVGQDWGNVPENISDSGVASGSSRVSVPATVAGFGGIPSGLDVIYPVGDDGNDIANGRLTDTRFVMGASGSDLHSTLSIYREDGTTAISSAYVFLDGRQYIFNGTGAALSIGVSYVCNVADGSHTSYYAQAGMRLTLVKDPAVFFSMFPDKLPSIAEDGEEGSEYYSQAWLLGPDQQVAETLASTYDWFFDGSDGHSYSTTVTLGVGEYLLADNMMSISLLSTLMDPTDDSEHMTIHASLDFDVSGAEPSIVLPPGAPAIPEPASVGLICGSIALAASTIRRRLAR